MKEESWNKTMWLSQAPHTLAPVRSPAALSLAPCLSWHSGNGPPWAPHLISFKPTSSYKCEPMRTLAIETQNLRGIPELQVYSKAICLGRFSDYQVGKAGMSRPLWVDMGTSIKKIATMKPQSPFPTGAAQSWGMWMCMWVWTCTHAYKPKLF